MKAKKLPSGSWSVYPCVNGVRRRFTGKNKRQVEADAAAWVNENRAERARGSFNESVVKFFEAKEGKLSPATIRGYQNVYKQMKKKFPRLCARECISITAGDLQDMVDDLEEDGYSPKTIRNYTGFVSSVMAFKHVRMPVVDLPPSRKEELTIPDEFTVTRLLHLAWELEDRQLWTCIALGAMGPLRRGEVCALREEDVDFDAGTIHVCHDVVRGPDREWIFKEPKTASSDRVLLMPSRVMEQIRRQGFYEKPGLQGEYVVSFYPDAMYNRYRRFLLKNDIPYFRFHDLRHYCASMLHAKGYPDAYIQARTGHAGPEVLRRVYTHALTDERAKIEEQMVADFDRLIL